MKLFDPSRPKSPHSQPLLLSGGLVPTWYVLPVTEQKVKVMVFLLTSGVSSYRDFSVEVPSEELSALWQEWLSDPELFVANRFGYLGPTRDPPRVNPAKPTAPTAKINETLEDLGL